MPTTTVPELLRRTPLFAELADAELRAVAAIAHRRRHALGEVIVQQDEPGTDLCVILSGYLKVMRSDPSGRTSAINIMGPGEVFGEVSLFDGGPRSATIMSFARSELLVIGRDAFLRFVESSPKVALALLRVLASRLRRLTERTDDRAFRGVDGRLATRLSTWAERFGQKQPGGGLRLPFKLSQQELGEFVDATRESANRRIHSWQQSGLLERCAGHLIVRDLAALQAIADAERA